MRESASVSENVFNSLTDQIVLDEHGSILAANEPWRKSAQANGAATNDFIGQSYLEICSRIVISDETAAKSALTGLRHLPDGMRTNFAVEYARRDLTETRWFRMHISPLGSASCNRLLNRSSSERMRA